MRKPSKTSWIGGERELVEVKKKVFITGLTGFAGTHLSHYLEKEGFEVYGTSWPEKVEGEKIFWLDLRNGRKLSKILKRIEPEWIFHLAALSHVGESWKNVKKTISTNFISTLNIFESAYNLPEHPRILFVSSAEVYGYVEKEDLPVKEEQPTNPLNPYAFSKLLGEILSSLYNSLGMEIFIVRPFNYTGPGQSPKFVCSDFAYQIAMIEKGKTKPEIRVGNLSVKRDFTDVRDVVKAFRIIIEKGERGSPYNICSGKSYSIEEILQILLKFSKEKIEITKDEKRFRKADVHDIYGDYSKLEKLGWKPVIPIEKTLQDIINFWRERI